MRRLGAAALSWALLSAAGCATATPPGSDPRPVVVATTPILADLARNVAGDRMRVVSLVPSGADPHTHELGMRAIRDVVHADVALSNYLLLEKHSVIKSLDHNLPASAVSVSLAEESTRHGAQVIPLVEKTGLDALWLGLRVRGSGAVLGASRASETEFSVTGVEGPGHLIGYITGTFGVPRVFANSQDGFDARDGFADDSLRLPVDAHTHMSWGFTAPGVYRLTLSGHLLNPGTEPVVVATGTVTLAVGSDPRADPALAGLDVLEAGHADITLDLDRGELNLQADPEGGGETRQRRMGLDSTVLWVPPSTLTEVPASPQYRFLGRPGELIHQLPQAVLGAHVHGEIDPHLWLDVKNARAYVLTIRDALARVDPAGTTDYADNARRYLGQLEELDTHVAATLATIDPASRHLVTTHDAYRYFAEAYGLQVAGFVAPNPGVEPSLLQRRRLTETLRNLRVPAVFIEPTVARETSVLATVARDAGIELCTIRSDTFDRDVTTYIDLMRANAASVTSCLGKEHS